MNRSDHFDPEGKYVNWEDQAHQDDPLEHDDFEPDPFEINFLPRFRHGRGPRKAFVNRYGVIIGDHLYDSSDSPLNHWSKDTDPSIMAGDEWVHPYKDIGFHTAENKDYFEKGIPPAPGTFMHTSHDAGFAARKGDGNHGKKQEEN